MSYHFIEMFGERGIGLGSQISQNLALISVNELDHYIKEKLRIKGYGRYMDDGYLIHESKEYLQKCLDDIRQICEELGVILNQNKTRIVKLEKGFTFLKIRFFLTQTGRIVKKVYPKSVTRMRRKLKKFKHLVEEGKMSEFDAYQSVQSWLSHTLILNSFQTRTSIKQLYYNLFGGKYVFKDC
ncbi:MAG: RNA-directed DNA polymerase [Clostridia bacterium]|nr:RNA-directed DNA polymerase [Clostridia bacterium]